MNQKVTIFSRDEIFDRFSGTPADLQRRTWLIGRENSEKSFAAVFTRRRRNDMATQPWRYHNDEEVEYIVTGRMEFEYKDADGTVHRGEAGPGDLYIIPAGVRHRADSMGDEPLVGVLFCPAQYSITEGQPFFLDEE